MMQQMAAVGLLGTGLVLGLRHGIDWDHIAAITDIASTTTTVEVAEAEQEAATLSARRPTFGQLEVRAMWLSFLYAIGHATVVFLLGVAALSFAALLPDWIDPLMERIVGVTLVILGLWVFYSLVQYLRGEGEFKLQSRWMVVFAGLRHGVARTRARVERREQHEHFHVEQYGPKTAYGVGMIHGIGAETGSQALIIASVGGAVSQGLGLGMLLTFVIGLVISNTAIAALASTGFITSARARPLYLTLGVLTGVFSLIVGAYFVLGVGSELPDLNDLLAPIFGGELE